MLTEQINGYGEYEKIKAACEPLNGVIASEDLKDRLLAYLLKNHKFEKKIST